MQTVRGREGTSPAGATDSWSCFWRGKGISFASAHCKSFPSVDGRNPANHLGCTKPCKSWDKLSINWWRILSVNSYAPKNQQLGPENRPSQEEKSSSNHPFSGSMLVSGRVPNIRISWSIVLFYNLVQLQQGRSSTAEVVSAPKVPLNQDWADCIISHKPKY